MLVWKRDGGLLDEDYENIQKLTTYFTQNPLEGQELVVPFDRISLPALKQQASEDGTAIVLPFFFNKSIDSDLLKQGITQIQEQAKADFGSDPFAAKLDDHGELSVRVSGPAGVSLDAVGLLSNADVSLLMTTVLLVLVLLLLIYRSPILAIIPLIAVGFAYGVTSPILEKMADLGWITFDSQSISIMTVLLFGAGTDYCLFLISRFRQLLLEERDKSKALVRAFRDSSGAIAMSGFTVVMALLVLLFAKYGAVHRFTVPFSLSILIMGIASLTLVPALLAIFGRVSFYPLVSRTPEMVAERARKKGKVNISKSHKKSRGWFVIHDIMGATAIQGLIPLYAFVFLVALGEDYNIFLISSIWKKRKSMPLKQAIQEGVTETGSVITSAGLILAGTFAVLATLPIQVLVQFGLICAIGVLLDTFVVRPLLVPSITMLLGRWAFWPGTVEGNTETSQQIHTTNKIN